MSFGKDPGLPPRCPCPDGEISSPHVISGLPWSTSTPLEPSVEGWGTVGEGRQSSPNLLSGRLISQSTTVSERGSGTEAPDERSTPLRRHSTSTPRLSSGGVGPDSPTSGVRAVPCLLFPDPAGPQTLLPSVSSTRHRRDGRKGRGWGPGGTDVEG